MPEAPLNRPTSCLCDKTSQIVADKNCINLQNEDIAFNYKPSKYFNKTNIMCIQIYVYPEYKLIKESNLFETLALSIPIPDCNWWEQIGKVQLSRAAGGHLIQLTPPRCLGNTPSHQTSQVLSMYTLIALQSAATKCRLQCTSLGK